MNNRTGFALLSVVTMMALLGAGCQKYAPSNGATRDNSDSGKNRPFGATEQVTNDAYGSAIDLDLPDDASKTIEKDLRSVVQPIFGDAKISSFMNNFPNETSLTLEYTTKKPTNQGDLNALLSSLKDKGYTIEFSGVTDGTAAVTAKSGNKNLIFGFKLNEQKISVSFMIQN